MFWETSCNQSKAQTKKATQNAKKKNLRFAIASKQRFNA
jgi:hypothetical protein